MLSIASLKPGIALTLDGEPYVVTKSEFAKQARSVGNTKTTLRNLKTGAHIQRTFGGNDRVEEADLEKARCQYLYKDADKAYFMHNETYEQFEVSLDSMGDQPQLLLENCEVHVLFFEGNPIGVELPPKMDLRVVETPPGVKGDTAQGGSKPAKLETGLTIQVPLFINEGEKIRVNTETLEYVERA